MQAKLTQQGTWVIQLQKGEPVCASLERFASDQGLGLARIQGIAGISDPELGCFDLKQQSFIRKTLPGYFELVSGMGNLSLAPDGRPYVHLHVSLADAEFRAWAGHLFEAQIAVLGEFFLIPEAEQLHREFSAELNVACWNLDRCQL